MCKRSNREGRLEEWTRWSRCWRRGKLGSSRRGRRCGGGRGQGGSLTNVDVGALDSGGGAAIVGDEVASLSNRGARVVVDRM